MRRKGELSRAVIDRDWPHQIAVRNSIAVTLGHVPSSGPYSSLCSRTSSIIDGGVGYQIYCFADPAQAARFKEFTEGEDFHPGDRFGGKWVRGRGAERAAKYRGWA